MMILINKKGSRLGPCYTRYGLWASSADVTWKLFRNMPLRPRPTPAESESAGSQDLRVTRMHAQIGEALS